MKSAISQSIGEVNPSHKYCKVVASPGAPSKNMRAFSERSAVRFITHLQSVASAKWNMLEDRPLIITHSIDNNRLQESIT